MAGDATNASQWSEADVYVAPLGSAVPADAETAFAAAWGLVGLLSGDDGFTQSRSEDKSDSYAWGGILVRTSRKNFKLTQKFSALEDNDVTRDLIWPGSTAGAIMVPRPESVLMAFETRDGDKIRRLITKDHAVVELDGDIVENETDLTKYELLATIFPDGNGQLFIEQVSA
jgi:hypothetical protein